VKRVGLIAGAGRFPSLIAEAVKGQGRSVVVIAHEGITDPVIEQIADRTVWVRMGQLGALIRGLKEHGAEEAAMAGGFRKTLLFSGIRPDFRALALLARMATRKDDVLLRGLAEELEKEGIRVIEATAYLHHLLARPGVMTRREPTAEEWSDIRFGWEMAREVGRLDIGQCVVVKDRAVLAVEAIEGTDEAIRRGGILGKGGSVVVKVCKPGQDTRFDLPTVGVRTLATMKEAGGAVLAVEAGKTVILDRDALLAEADAAGIAVVGLTEP